MLKKGILIAVAVVLMGGGFYVLRQRAFVEEHCATQEKTLPARCGAYFTSWRLRFFEGNARQHLTRKYREFWEYNATSVDNLRRMMVMETPHLEGQQHDEIRKLYEAQSRTKIDTFYNEWISSYQKDMTEVKPDYRQAVVALLTQARDSGKPEIAIRFDGGVAISQSWVRWRERKVQKNVEPMEPSFSETLNQRREARLMSLLQKAFNSAFAASLMTFVNSANADVSDDTRIEIKYRVSPTKRAYRDNVELYYWILEFDWLVKFYQKGKRIAQFEFKSRSANALNVRVSRRDPEGADNIDRVYDGIAQTAFDQFAVALAKHLGFDETAIGG